MANPNNNFNFCNFIYLFQTKGQTTMNYTNHFNTHSNNFHYDHIGQQQNLIEAIDNHITNSSGVPLIDDHGML